MRIMPIRVGCTLLACLVILACAASIAVSLRVDMPSAYMAQQVGRALLLLVPALAALLVSCWRPRLWLDYALLAIPPFCLILALAVLLLCNTLAALGVLVIQV